MKLLLVSEVTWNIKFKVQQLVQNIENCCPMCFMCGYPYQKHTITVNNVTKNKPSDLK